MAGAVGIASVAVPAGGTDASTECDRRSGDLSDRAGLACSNDAPEYRGAMLPDASAGAEMLEVRGAASDSMYCSSGTGAMGTLLTVEAEAGACASETSLAK
jgi:hypothetical protein